MSFEFVDRVVELEVGRRIVCVKALSRGEDYLQDHFPRFPVMPGVLMLECMVQAATWLLRVTDDFAHSMVVLREAAQVRYAGFVKPGQTLQVQVDLEKQGDRESVFKATGTLGETNKQVVSSKLVLDWYNLADSNPEQLPTDEYLRDALRRQWETLCGSDLSGLTTIANAGSGPR